MLTVGTVFSGIGAPEQALKRLNIPHEIAFACDSGDVCLFEQRNQKSGETAADMSNLFEQAEVLVSALDDGEHYRHKLQYLKSLYNGEIGQLDMFSAGPSDDVREEVRISIESMLEQLNTEILISSVNTGEDVLSSVLHNASKKNHVRKSYLANYSLPEEHFFQDIRFFDGKPYKDKIDLFVGGSPCQSFSVSGKRAGLTDARGTLFYEYGRLIDEIQPKVFVYENVRNLVHHENGNTWKHMLEVLFSLGYTVQWKVMDAKDYGVPQSRKRLFAVGFRNDVKTEGFFSFPEPAELTVTLQDLLEDDVPEKYFLSEKMVKYVTARGTGSYVVDTETDLPVAHALTKTMHKYHRANIDNYVTQGGRLRALTPRECLRLMGFSDDFRIVVSDTQMYMQTGNSIVVDVLMRLFECIFTSVPELLKDCGDRLMQGCSV